MNRFMRLLRWLVHKPWRPDWLAKYYFRHLLIQVKETTKNGRKV